MTALTTDILQTLRQRRSAGESVKAMAVELGITWQKLDKAIRNGIRSHAERRKAIQADDKPGPLTEKYRPRRLDGLWGQVEVVRALGSFAVQPFPIAFVFEGETGTGKTSAAIALAAELGCDLSQKPPEFGGLHVIASGEQTADTVRDIHNQMWRSPFYGSGWKVLIVNEADRMSTAAETIWLDRLESLPPRTVIIFTTNFPEKLSQRFRDRCTRLAFESSADKIAGAAGNLARAIWRRETGKNPAAKMVADIVGRATEDGKISLRRVVQVLSPMVLAAKGGGR